MKLISKLVPDWPKLAWVASFERHDDHIHVLHGPMVETAVDWIAEAVWAGDFDKGDFDRTELVFGSGVRAREAAVTFVSSGTTIDRLWYTWDGQKGNVSNSLPAILAVTGLSLRLDYDHYVRDIATIIKGLGGYITSIPTDGAQINVVYFDNLVFNGDQVQVASKPDTAPQFRCYDDYIQFLTGTAAQLGQNATSSKRSFSIQALSSISSGYDSPAAAVIARAADCCDTVTFGRATSFWRGPDSGRAIAEQLGLACVEHHDWRKRRCSDESAVWAATGRCCDLGLATLDYPDPLCMFFTGFCGDIVWDYGKRTGQRSFSRTDTSGLGLCEYRLIKGFFNIPVPFWGARHKDELHLLSQSEEMSPWRLGGSYDRPLPRRILEDAGVQRGSFAVRKKNTQSEEFFTWPRSPQASREFSDWLDAAGVRRPNKHFVPALKSITAADNLLAKNVLYKFGWRHKGVRNLLLYRANGLLFQWGNQRLQARCTTALQKLGDHQELAVDVPSTLP